MLPLQLCWLLLMLATCTSLEQLLPLASTLVDSAQNQRALPVSPSTRLFSAEQLHHPLLPLSTLPPDATCGFISGLAGAGYTCGVGATCVFFTASQSSQAPGHVACCNSNECNARNVCIDYNEYFSQSKCDNGCAVDTFTLKCTSTDAPYCNTISFPGDIMDVFCNNVNITGIQAALTTYRGESSRTFRPLTLTDNEATTTTDDPTSTGLTSSSSPSASGTGGGGSSGDNNGSSGDNDNGSKNSGGSKSNTGAIVGGVVGGVGGLALIGLAVFFFLRRRNSAAAGHEPVSQNAPPPVIYPAPGMQQSPPDLL
ncbi:uncharacterized protein TrAtP1_005764 [Trichoderma atroviride]|uniref:uncharacterized protein n=1 Tax=Hypocrea atroviridis TaxID=63577 RepID=UPI003323FCC0|nr:hypothetical protein TrAtP1_005764 [Trichoderma atroviride]